MKIAPLNKNYNISRLTCTSFNITRQQHTYIASVNKEKVTETFEVAEKDLIDAKFLLLQKGKKNYFIVKAV